MSITQLENHSQLLCGCDSWSANLTFRTHTSKIKQNYLKYRDLAPLIYLYLSTNLDTRGIGRTVIALSISRSAQNEPSFQQ